MLLAEGCHETSLNFAVSRHASCLPPRQSTTPKEIPVSVFVSKSRQQGMSERLARRISRREAVTTFAKGAAGSVAAFTLGDFIRPSKAYASHAECCFPFGYCGVHLCPSANSCPSGWTVCRSTDCSACPYSDGDWVSTQCSPCGPGALSYRMCRDCRKNGCADKCTCVTSCLCSNCTTPAEVVEFQNVLAHTSN